MVEDGLLLLVVEDLGVGVRISRRLLATHDKTIQIDVLSCESVAEVVLHVVLARKVLVQGKPIKSIKGLVH